MTFVGKMLVVLQVVLSLLFMAFAGAVATVEKNWKQEFTGSQDQLKVEMDFHQTTQNLFNEYKNKSTTTIADLDTQSKKRLADFNREKNRADNFQTALNNLKTAHDTQRTVAQLEGDEAKFRREEAVEQRQVNSGLHMNLVESVRTNRGLEDIIFDLRLQLGTREVRHLVILDQLKTAGIRCAADFSGNKIGGKIRDAEMNKVHTMLVLGKKEQESASVALRIHGHGDQGVKPLALALAEIKTAITKRSL